MPKRFANEQYRLACTEPYLWLRKARELRRTADLVWEQFVAEINAFTQGQDSPEPFTGDVAMMLYGLTIENLLKAGLAAKGCAVGANGNFKLKVHNLQALTSELSLAVSQAEAELLERLQHFIEWAGRYPIPLLAEGLYPREMLDGSKCALHGISTGDRLKIMAFIEKLSSALPTEDEALESYAKTIVPNIASQRTAFGVR